MKGLRFVSIIWICFSLFGLSQCHNKYSKDANKSKLKPSYDTTRPGDDLRPISLRHLDRPFRMAKLNLLWSKAVYVRFVQLPAN